ncbi:hypothetical protein LU635_07345 [Gramella sp. YB25]|uniref:Uncharacterized protein n=1 Tax=Christiangramia crocea TaxID=2904124 RepID=A0A9X1UWG7_9FLAO|nr:hypothetical protein [Gramella crocea]
MNNSLKIEDKTYLRHLKLKSALWLSGIILFLYWSVMWHFGGYPHAFNLQRNAALKFALFIFPEENLWRGFGVPFDPEGLFSTLNIIAGYAIGKLIQSNNNQTGKVLYLSGIGVLFLIAAQIWDAYFPVNKGIWTSGFVIYSTGWELIILGVLILIIEIAGFKKWICFFEAFGKNPSFSGWIRIRSI